MPNISFPVDPNLGPVMDVLLGPAHRQVGEGLSRRKCRALIDTGSQQCLVDNDLAISLGLKESGGTELMTPGGTQSARVFNGSLIIEAPLLTTELPVVRFTGAQLADQGFTVILGRELLRRFALIYDGQGATATLCV